MNRLAKNWSKSCFSNSLLVRSSGLFCLTIPVLDVGTHGLLLLKYLSNWTKQGTLHNIIKKMWNKCTIMSKTKINNISPYSYYNHVDYTKKKPSFCHSRCCFDTTHKHQICSMSDLYTIMVLNLDLCRIVRVEFTISPIARHRYQRY